MPDPRGNPVRVPGFTGIRDVQSGNRIPDLQIGAELFDRIRRQLRLVEGLTAERNVGVAVSGGGDSTALLILMQAWCERRGLQLRAVSVDHQLRPESRDECLFVNRLATDLGVSHQILAGEVRPPGNMQEAARLLRYTLIASWAAANEMKCVALAHTMDDQAETFLLNLARGSGVDGLAAMPLVVRRFGVTWVRPLLEVRRTELRNYLKENGFSWMEDPSNADDRFDRVKARKLLKLLSPLGAGVERLAATAGRMQDARVVLENAAASAEARLAVVGNLDDTCFNGDYWGLPRETGLRLAADAVRIVGRSDHRPRMCSLRAALDSVREGRTATLAGVMLVPTPGAGFTVVRELSACDVPVQGDKIWDGRWKLAGKKAPAGSLIGPLGHDGLLICRNWRDAGRSRECLVSSPALRLNGELLSAPFAGMSNGWHFVRVPAAESRPGKPATV